MYIQKAFELAQMTQGQTGTNPAVGCIIEKDGVIVGLGAHLKQGDLHAERQAIKMAGDNARGATLYCTLEPCSHTGKTPPCTEGIIDAGIKKVVFAERDITLSRCADTLADCGIEVVHEPHENISEFYRKFFNSKSGKQCNVTLKCAMTLDAKLADDKDMSKWLTNELSRHDVHQLRHQMDAVLVGHGTYKTDAPKLDARYYSEKLPAKVIVAHSDVKLHANDLTTKQRIIIVTDGEQSSDAQIIRLNCLSPQHIIEALYKEGIQNLLVEGGATILSQFLEAGCFDRFIVYFAPKILGGTERNRLFHTDIKLMEHMQHLELMDVTRFEDDIKISYRKGQQRCLQDSSKKSALLKV